MSNALFKKVDYALGPLVDAIHHGWGAPTTDKEPLP